MPVADHVPWASLPFFFFFFPFFLSVIGFCSIFTVASYDQFCSCLVETVVVEVNASILTSLCVYLTNIKLLAGSVRCEVEERNFIPTRREYWDLTTPVLLDNLCACHPLHCLVL